MARRYLLSFCNNQGRLRLALVTPEGIERVIELAPNLLATTAQGITGVSVDGGDIILAIQSRDAAAIRTFDRDFILQSEFRAAGAADIHGVLAVGAELLIVSSGTNQLLAVNRRLPERRRVVWTDGGEAADRHHLNDLCRTEQGALLMSSFGARRADGMRSGAVIDVGSGQILCEGLREPHSLCWWDGALYVLESPFGDLLRMRPGLTPERLTGIIGYARGLAIDADTIAIGKSGYREMSRGRLGDGRSAPLTPPGTGPELLSCSGVWFIDRRSGDARWVETTDCGAEIYQIVPLTD